MDNALVVELPRMSASVELRQMAAMSSDAFTHETRDQLIAHANSALIPAGS